MKIIVQKVRRVPNLASWHAAGIALGLYDEAYWPGAHGDPMHKQRHTLHVLSDQLVREGGEAAVLIEHTLRVNEGLAVKLDVDAWFARFSTPAVLEHVGGYIAEALTTTKQGVAALNRGVLRWEQGAHETDVLGSDDMRAVPSNLLFAATCYMANEFGRAPTSQELLGVFERRLVWLYEQQDVRISFRAR